MLGEEGFGTRLGQVGTRQVIIRMAISIKAMPSWITMHFEGMTGVR